MLGSLETVLFATIYQQLEKRLVALLIEYFVGLIEDNEVDILQTEF